jgi:hypothetical protein
MAGRIVYLEIDDEITSAAARIRASDASRIAVVLPYGSRVATSRINFRLLSRDALTHEKRLSIVSGDAATRALAASAGLPVFASVAEYEGSLAGVDDEPRPATDVPVVPAAVAATASGATGSPTSTRATEPETGSEPAPDGTLGLVVPAAAAAAAVLPGETVRSSVPRGPTYERQPPEPPARPGAAAPAPTSRARGRIDIRTPWLVGGAILALAVLIAGVGAYLVLPSATIAVTPRPEGVGPIQVTVVADPNATQPDAVAGVVPATTVSIPVSVDDTFAATGKRVALTQATGTVRFQNLDPTSTNRIPAGSVVRTGSAIRFRTAVTITVPRAELIGFQIFPASASVKVTAIEGGPDGNVEPNTIVIVPSGENPIFLKVTNPQATTGGRRQEFTRVTQADVDGAVAALNASLQTAFQEAMSDPSLTAGGATVFPGSGSLGEAKPTVAPATLVGQEVATFPLGLSATGTVVTADTAPVTAIAETQLHGEVKPGHELIAGSVDIRPGDAIVTGQTVSIPVVASAQQVAILDPAQLKAKVLGKSIDEARAILEPFGGVELRVSPDWAGSVPSFESRVDLTVQYPVRIESPAPSGSPGP